MNNLEIVNSLHNISLNCKYQTGKSVLIAMEGEILPELPDGMYVHRIKHSCSYRYEDERIDEIPCVSSYVCRMMSVATQFYFGDESDDILIDNCSIEECFRKDLVEYYKTHNVINYL